MFSIKINLESVNHHTFGIVYIYFGKHVITCYITYFKDNILNKTFKLYISVFGSASTSFHNCSFLRKIHFASTVVLLVLLLPNKKPSAKPRLSKTVTTARLVTKVGYTNILFN